MIIALLGYLMLVLLYNRNESFDFTHPLIPVSRKLLGILLLMQMIICPCFLVAAATTPELQQLRLTTAKYEYRLDYQPNHCHDCSDGYYTLHRCEIGSLICPQVSYLATNNLDYWLKDQTHLVIDEASKKVYLYTGDHSVRTFTYP